MLLAAFERTVEVDADSVTCPSGVLLRQRENERRRIAQRESSRPDADAAFRLTEEDNIGRQREVAMVVMWVSTEQLRCLNDRVVAIRMSSANDEDIVEQTRTEELLLIVVRSGCHGDACRHRTSVPQLRLRGITVSDFTEEAAPISIINHSSQYTRFLRDALPSASSNYLQKNKFKKTEIYIIYRPK